MDKAQYRRMMKTRLADSDVETARRSAFELTERVLALPAVRDSDCIFSCLSFGREIDTRGLIDRLLDSGRRVFVPRTQPRSRKLILHAYPCRLERRSFGLDEPAVNEPALDAKAIDSNIQVALVLGLAFDSQGYRLGYGGGYFDRFLVDRPFPAIGLAYDFQLTDRLPTDPHDLPMQTVVTEQRILLDSPQQMVRSRNDYRKK